MSALAIKVGAVALVQLALVGGAVAPRLSARLTGEEYRLRVTAYDPVDPLRGSYVDLAYPGLQHGEALPRATGIVYLPLVHDGETWTASRATSSRPDHGPYLACDEHGDRLDCGIESLWLPQDRATEMQKTLRDGAVAVVRIDSRGHAALVRVEAG
jgi:uncharacterized membrane-anchored protein